MKPSLVTKQFEQYEQKREVLQMEINKSDTKVNVDYSVFKKTAEERKQLSFMKSDYKKNNK